MKFGFSKKNNERNINTTQFKAFDAIPDLPTDIQELMLKAVEVRKMPMLRTLNLELSCNLLDNGEIVLARTKKTQLILRTCAERVAIFHAGAIYPTAKF
jgi:cytidine deaminase